MALEDELITGTHQRGKKRRPLHVGNEHLVAALVGMSVERNAPLASRPDLGPDHHPAVGIARKVPALELQALAELREVLLLLPLAVAELSPELRPRPDDGAHEQAEQQGHQWETKDPRARHDANTLPSRAVLG